MRCSLSLSLSLSLSPLIHISSRIIIRSGTRRGIGLASSRSRTQYSSRGWGALIDGPWSRRKTTMNISVCAKRPLNRDELVEEITLCGPKNGYVWEAATRFSQTTPHIHQGQHTSSYHLLLHRSERWREAPNSPLGRDRECKYERRRSSHTDWKAPCKRKSSWRPSSLC